MNNFFVSDLSKVEFQDTVYDLCILVAGYEPRCTLLSEILDKKRVKKVLVFNYLEHSSTDTTTSISNTFSRKWGSSSRRELSSSDYASAFRSLLDITSSMLDKQDIRVLVDYSSMSKSTMSVILFFFSKFFCQKQQKSISIDFSYSVGEYPDIEECRDFFKPKVILGCEGLPLTREKKLGIFMLGFDSIGPQVSYNFTTPNKSFSVIAKPSIREAYVERVLSANNEFISAIGGNENLISLPLSSVESTFKYLTSLVAPFDDHNVTFSLFGPKTHTLSAMLLSQNISNVTCISASTNTSSPRLVRSSGEIVYTRLKMSCASEKDVS